MTLARLDPAEFGIIAWAGNVAGAGYDSKLSCYPLSVATILIIMGASLEMSADDQKIPKDVLDRLMEIANVCGLVAQFFKGDAAKTALWFKTQNPLLGSLSPRDVIRYGRYEKLRRFVMDALEENATAGNLQSGDMPP